LATLEMYWHNFLGTYEKNIDHYIVPSEFVKNILISRGLNSQKITILPHFISTELEPTQNNESKFKNIIREQFLQEEIESEKYALFIGRETEGKGVKKIIRIFKSIDKNKLYLAGDLNYAKNRKTAKIKNLGWLNASNLKRYIQKAQFVISTSSLPETFGLVALEAISQGTPFVGYKTGAYPEIITNGENGYLIEKNESFKKIIEKINNGKIKFSNQKKIRQEALDNYGNVRYYNKLIRLFKKQLK
jgi:glycosyltransferase involved in cell wall biosynthesis